MHPLEIRLMSAKDIPWVQTLFETEWEGEFVVSRGKKYYPHDLLGMIAYHNTEKVGLLTFRPDGNSIEIVTLNSLIKLQGIGKALINAVITYARKKGITSIWLVTTNNNSNAQAFYQHLGFKKTHVFEHALAESRKLKPSIPFVDESGVPIRDEFKYEYQL